MFSSAEKTKPVTVRRQQQAAAPAFFRKAGEETFFGAEKQSSFFSPVIQTKLTVSSPDDPQEKEADAVADTVMRMPDPVSVQAKDEEKQLDRKEGQEEEIQTKHETALVTVQRKCESCEKEETTQAKLFRMVQRSEETEGEETAVQAKQAGLYRSDIFKQSGRGPPVNSIQPSFEQSLSSSKGSGSALPTGTQQFMESRFNADFSGVRIHTGSYAESMSSTINAQAFAHGNDIYFNSGKYSPNTEAGGTLLAHELTHTVQQGASPVNTSTNVAAKTTSKNTAQTKRICRYAQTGPSSPENAGQYNLAAVWQQQSLLKRNGTNVKPQPHERQQQLPHLNRCEENENDTSEQAVLHTKQEISSWQVNHDGALQTSAPVIQMQTGERELQKKEEELQREEDEITASPALELQAKAISTFSLPATGTSIPAVTFYSRQVQTKNFAGNELTANNPVSSPAQVYTASERGPPLVQMQQDKNSIHRSAVDDALNFVSGSSLLGCISILDPASTGPCLLQKARDVALHIPGYRALRVVLGSDPITGEHIERNGHNFIEAAFDIMPGGMLLHQKLQEQGQLDAAAAWIDGKIEELDSIVSNVTGSFTRFWNSLSIDRFSDPMDVIREGAGIVFDFISSIVSFAIRTAGELLQMVKNFLLNAIVDFIKERTTAYPLLTVILGEDPVTKQPVARNGTNILNALLELGGEEGIKQRTQMQETGTFQRIVGYIDEGIVVFGNLYQTIVNNFSLIWDAVSIDSLIHPVDTFTRLYNVFAEPIAQVLDFVRRVAAEILKLIKEVLMQRLSAWARQQRGYALVTVIIGKDPFTDAAVPFTMENVIKGFFSLMEGGEEQYNQLKESGAIDRTVAKITAAVTRLNMTPQAIVQLFIGLWNSFSIHDLADPVAAFQRIIDRFGEPIGRLINFVIEIVKIVVEAILIVMNFPFDLINNIIRRAMATMDRIKRDPVAFLKNLLRAIKQGFIQFFDNILTHLLNGVVGWLMSELRDANIPALTDFSLRGVIGWVLQVLGISMEAIWAKLAAHPRIGPQRVARIRSMISSLDGIWTFIKDVQERGMAAIWDKIQEQLTNLWDTVINAVKNWITEQIVNRVVARLLSMLDPTGIMAVVNSAIAIYSAIQSFIRYLREILEVINSFVNGVADIAEGNVTTAANYLERTMGRAMPIVIGFLANQVGLSGVGRRVGEMIERVREMVDNALTWLVNRAVDTGMNLLDRLMGRGRDNPDGTSDVKELAQQRLVESAGSSPTEERIRAAIPGVLSGLQSQGLQELFMHEDEEGSVHIAARASPVKDIMKLASRMSPVRPSVVSGIRITLNQERLSQYNQSNNQLDTAIPQGSGERGEPGSRSVRSGRGRAATTVDYRGVQGQTGRASGRTGGAIINPDYTRRIDPSLLNSLVLVTWNNGTIDTRMEVCHNHSHAETQFIEWFKAQSQAWRDLIEGIDIHLTVSPCTFCAADLSRLLQTHRPPNLVRQSIGWENVYVTNGRCRELSTTQQSLANLSQAWNLSGPTPDGADAAGLNLERESVESPRVIRRR